MVICFLSPLLHCELLKERDCLTQYFIPFSSSVPHSHYMCRNQCTIFKSHTTFLTLTLPELLNGGQSILSENQGLMRLKINSSSSFKPCSDSASSEKPSLTYTVLSPTSMLTLYLSHFYFHIFGPEFYMYACLLCVYYGGFWSWWLFYFVIDTLSCYILKYLRIHAGNS